MTVNNLIIKCFDQLKFVLAEKICFYRNKYQWSNHLIMNSLPVKDGKKSILYEFVQSKIMLVNCNSLKIMAPRMTEYILDSEVKPHIIHGKMNPKIHLNENKLKCIIVFLSSSRHEFAFLCFCYMYWILFINIIFI